MEGMEICCGIFGQMGSYGKGQLEIGPLMKPWDTVIHIHHSRSAAPAQHCTTGGTHKAARMSPLCTPSTAWAPASCKAQAPS